MQTPKEILARTRREFAELIALQSPMYDWDRLPHPLPIRLERLVSLADCGNVTSAANAANAWSVTVGTFAAGMAEVAAKNRAEGEGWGVYLDLADFLEAAGEPGGPGEPAQPREQRVDLRRTASPDPIAAAAPELLAALRWALAVLPDSLEPDHHAAFEAATALVERLDNPTNPQP